MCIQMIFFSTEHLLPKPWFVSQRQFLVAFVISDERRPSVKPSQSHQILVVQVRNIQAYRAKYQRLPVRGSNEPSSGEFPGELDSFAVGCVLCVEHHSCAFLRFTLSWQLPVPATQNFLCENPRSTPDSNGTSWSSPLECRARHRYWPSSRLFWKAIFDKKFKANASKLASCKFALA